MMNILFYGIVLVVLGVLAVPSLVIAKRPEAKDLINKIAPYQGWLGTGAAFYGVWAMIQALMHMSFMKYSMIGWVTWAATGFVLFALGMLLGVGTIKTFVKQPDAVEKIDQLIAKLAPKQGVLGIAGIGLGIWCIVANFIL